MLSTFCGTRLFRALLTTTRRLPAPVHTQSVSLTYSLILSPYLYVSAKLSIPFRSWRTNPFCGFHIALYVQFNPYSFSRLSDNIEN
jgi:hypothetical protein